MIRRLLAMLAAVGIIVGGCGYVTVGTFQHCPKGYYHSGNDGAFKVCEPNGS